VVDVEVAGAALGESRGTLGRQERGKETRRNLTRTAARLWSERGFDDVTVEEICSEAGIGRTTFYLHFESKEQLLASLAGATSTGVAADLEAAHSSDSLDEQLDVLIRGIVRRMQDVPKSLAELVIHSQRMGLMKAARADFAGSTATCWRMPADAASWCGRPIPTSWARSSARSPWTPSRPGPRDGPASR
jgi:AcrR family transcriptional regulator